MTNHTRMAWPLWLVVIGFLMAGLVYDTATPIFEASDEQSHYPYIKYLADGHGLPVQDPNVQTAWRQEGSQPPLYYILGALATFWIDTSDAAERLTVNPHAIIGVPAHDSNDNRNFMVHTPAERFPYQRTTLAVHLVRWLSLLMGAGTILATYALAQRITGETTTATLAALLVAFNPMFVFLSAAVNNDNAVILFSTLSLWQLIRIWQAGLTTRRVVALGVLLGLASLSKLSALGLIGVAGLMLTWQAARCPVPSPCAAPISFGNLSGDRSLHALRAAQGMALACLARIRARHRMSKWQGASAKSSIIVRLFTVHGSLFTPLLLIAGWWYARNWLLYGDPTGLNRMLAIVGARQGTPQLLPLLRAEAEGMWLSFWGLFGGVNVLAAPWVYAAFNLLSAVALVGLLWRSAQWTRQRPLTMSAQPSALLWLTLWLIVLLASWMRWTLITPATQGRLIFPALATIAITLAIGLSALVPRRLLAHAVMALGIGLFLIALRVALFDIAPAYTPAPLVAQVPVTAARDPIRFGDALELVGLETPTLTAHSGETVEVALYWKAVAPMGEDYSVFAHLLDAGDLIIGQRDSYPGLGLRPTTQLRVGDIVRDVYRIAIDPSAIAPSEPQLRVGVYKFKSGQRLPSAQGDNPAIGKINLLARASGSTPNPIAFNFDNYFSLTGYTIDRVAVAAGDAFTLTLYWRANSPAPKDYSVFTHVLGKNDALWGQVDRQLPTTTWQNGQIVQDVHVIQVKRETPPDVYEIEVGAYDLSDNFKRLGVWGADGQFVGDRVLLRKIRVFGK